MRGCSIVNEDKHPTAEKRRNIRQLRTEKGSISIHSLTFEQLSLICSPLPVPSISPMLPGNYEEINMPEMPEHVRLRPSFALWPPSNPRASLNRSEEGREEDVDYAVSE